jgi:hypothetical protein
MLLQMVRLHLLTTAAAHLLSKFEEGFSKGDGE